MLIKVEHIEAVSRYIVSGTRKRHDKETAHSALEPCRGVECERHACQGSTDENLHGKYPPALSTQQVNERTPQRLYYPRKIQPTGI